MRTVSFSLFFFFARHRFSVEVASSILDIRTNLPSRTKRYSFDTVADLPANRLRIPLKMLQYPWKILQNFDYNTFIINIMSEILSRAQCNRANNFSNWKNNSKYSKLKIRHCAISTDGNRDRFDPRRRVRHTYIKQIIASCRTFQTQSRNENNTLLITHFKGYTLITSYLYTLNRFRRLLSPGACTRVLYVYLLFLFLVISDRNRHNSSSLNAI